MISVCFHGKPFNITVIQVYALTSNAEEADMEQFYEDLQDLLEHTRKILFACFLRYGAGFRACVTPGFELSSMSIPPKALVSWIRCI